MAVQRSHFPGSTFREANPPGLGWLVTDLFAASGLLRRPLAAYQPPCGGPAVANGAGRRDIHLGRVSPLCRGRAKVLYPAPAKRADSGWAVSPQSQPEL